MRGKSGGSVDVNPVHGINPASAGKRLHSQQVFLTTIQFSLNCGSYPSAASTAAATSKTTRPFSNVVGAAQLAETSQAAGAVTASAHSAPRRPPRNAQHIERYIPCPQPSAHDPDGYVPEAKDMSTQEPAATSA